MAIRAVVSLANPTVSATHANVTAAIAHTKLAPTVTHTAAAMADLVLVYVPKNKIIPDVCVLSELTVISSSKSLADSLQTIDGQSKTVGKSQIDEVASLDSQHWGFEKYHDDPVAMLDTHAANFSKAATDQAALVDLSSLAVSLNKDSDIVGFTDYLSMQFTHVRLFNDAFGLDDYANVNKDFIGSKGNIFGFSDLATFTYQKPFTDEFGYTDQHNIETALGKADFLPVIDAAVIYSAKRAEDATALADLNIWNLSKPAADAISTSDLSSFVVSKTHADAIATADTFNRAVEFQREFEDTLVLQEQFSTGDKEINKQNAVGLSEQASLSSIIARTDTAILLESAAVSTTKPADDSFSANDTFSRSVGFNRAVSDSATTADVFSPHFTKTASDSATFTDVVTQTRTFNRSFADWFALDDFSSVDKNLAGTKTNIFGFTDVHACEVEKEVADFFGFLESVTVTRRSAAGFNTASFNDLLFN